MNTLIDPPAEVISSAPSDEAPVASSPLNTTIPSPSPIPVNTLPDKVLIDESAMNDDLLFNKPDTLWHEKAKKIEERKVDLSKVSDESLKLLIDDVIKLDAGSDRYGFVSNTIRSIKPEEQYQRFVDLYLKALSSGRADKSWFDSDAFILGYIFNTTKDAYIKIENSNIEVYDTVQSMLAERIKDLDLNKIYPGNSEGAKRVFREVFDLLLSESGFTQNDLISFIGFGQRITPNSLYLMSTVSSNSQIADPEVYIKILKDEKSSPNNEITDLFVVVCSIFKLSMVDNNKTAAKSLFDRIPEKYSYLKNNRRITAMLGVA